MTPRQLRRYADVAVFAVFFHGALLACHLDAPARTLGALALGAVGWGLVAVVRRAA